MEMNQQTLARMSQMRLLGMYAAFKTSMESFKSESMTTDQFVSWLIENEWDDRTNRLIQRLQKQASFRYRATVEEIDYTINRGLDRNQIMRLSDMTFVTEPRDLFITGSAGTGKSFIATALGYSGMSERHESALCKHRTSYGTAQGRKSQRNHTDRTQEDRAHRPAHTRRLRNTPL